MMGCEYCGGKQKSIIYDFEYSSYQYWVCIDKGMLIFDGVFNDVSPLKRRKINYCPMCGRKLGDTNLSPKAKKVYERIKRELETR